MTKLATDPRRRLLMQRVRQRGTPAEKLVAKLCCETGVSYRLNVSSLPGSPDLANKRRRWAIFVNGCFWHHHTACALATRPARNADFWSGKFRANRERDARKIKALRSAGYHVTIVWQCETRDPKTLRARLTLFLGTRPRPHRLPRPDLESRQRPRPRRSPTRKADCSSGRTSPRSGRASVQS